MRIANNTTILLVVLFAAAAVVRAQTSTGEVNGTVTYNSGGAIFRGAAVKLANQGTKERPPGACLLHLVEMSGSEQRLVQRREWRQWGHSD